MLRARTLTCGHSWRSASAACSPFICGMDRSSTATSGLAARAFLHASWPSAAWATTCMSCWELISSTRPSRMTVWSSASRTRMGFMGGSLVWAGGRRQGDAGVDGGAGAGGRFDVEGAPGQDGPFSHAQQAQVAVDAGPVWLQGRLGLEAPPVVFDDEGHVV